MWLKWWSSEKFSGGVHPPQMKAMSMQQPLRELPLASEYVLPLRQHAGGAARPIVRVGEQVRKYQLIATPGGSISAALHAPTSGTVIAIEPRPIAHASGLQETAIVIRADGRDVALSLDDALQDVFDPYQDQLIRIVQAAGIVGLGGAVFPTNVKLHGRQLDTLLINGAECEPYITCDDLLMQTQPQQVIEAVTLLVRALRPQQAVIAVEDNKPAAIAALRGALAARRHVDATVIRVHAVPTVYPTGGEKQLIRIVTGREVPSRRLPLDIGVMCINVATASAIADAVFNSIPLIERIITVTGEGITAPGNYRIRIGTPLQHIIEQCGGYRSAQPRVTFGGPMMGLTLSNTDVPIVKGTNCILVRDGAAQSQRRPMPCIRCGACAQSCPMQLLPQQLYRFAMARQFDKAAAHHLADCIECGCCDYVCPAHLPLVESYRYAKSELRTQLREQQKAAQLRERFEWRQARLHKEAAARKERRRPASATSDAAPSSDSR